VLAFGNNVGIVGGLGPETTARFYLDLTEAFRKQGISPKITIDNVAFPLSLEEEIIKLSKNEHLLLPCLKASVKRLNNAQVDAIVMPCNTAHLFIDQLRKISGAPIISIIEETAKSTRQMGLKKVGILSSAKTLQSQMYQKQLYGNVSLILPDHDHQLQVSQYILNLLHGKQKGKKAICDLGEEMKKQGAEAIILACTDLRLGLKRSDIDIPIIDSYEALLNAAIRAIEKHF
jgi:aspartate racemase